MQGREDTKSNLYWKRVAGIEHYKVNWYFKYYLYKLFGIRLPKLGDQREYWERRGQVYREEITSSGYLDREIFFQDMLIDELKHIEFNSFFEAGCGFGWNIARVKSEFPEALVGGLDFSFTQLQGSKAYAADQNMPVVNGDACRMPFKENSFDVGFSLGVFMNIHPRKIRDALVEMLRVCRTYIIHLEYDENHTTPELREKRAFKTNIVSHDYKGLYEKLGAKVVKFLTFEDFGEAFRGHIEKVTSSLDRWEGFEGPEKYIFTMIEV